MPGERLTENDTARDKRRLFVMLGLALALRLVLAAFTEGYGVDTGNFFAWALRLADGGWAHFYAPYYFADYPPGYMPVLWAVGKLMRALGLSQGSAAAVLLLDAVPIICDIALAYSAYRMARQTALHEGAPLLCGILAFNPVLFFDSAVWNQIDSVFSLAILASFVLLERKSFAASGLLFALALLIKTQALIVGPVYAICFLMPVFRSAGKRRDSLLNILKAFVPCMALLLIFSFMFCGSQRPVVWLWDKYAASATLYKYASCNAFNLSALLGGQWAPDSAKLLGLAWKQWGFAGIALVTALTAWFAARAYKRGNLPIYLLCGFYGCGIFTLSHNMHERYLIPAIVFLFAAFARMRDKRILRISLLLSAACFVNMAAVYFSAESDPFLASSYMRVLTALVSAANVFLFAYLVYVTYDICVKGRIKVIEDFDRQPFDYSALGSGVPEWTRKDTVFISIITAITAVVSLVYLGDVRAPESGVTANEPVSGEVCFSQNIEIGGVFCFPGISQGELRLMAADGAEIGFFFDQNNSFTWTAIEAEKPLAVRAGERVRVTLSGGLTLEELGFTDRAGEKHDPTDYADALLPLFDEQELIPKRRTQLNGMYFDEIYHGRTAYEHLHGLDVYETTHPPLGKILIMLGVWLFGMNPFGWRVIGALFGVTMVPLMYLLARELLKKRERAAFAATVFAADFMRFVQTRLATIDVYVVFFIILASFFMLRGCRAAVSEGFKKATLPLALGGAAFGCACASKWSGLYAGLGLAALYFGALYARKKRLDAAGRGIEFASELKRALAIGCAFYVAVPAVIYILSYLPYFLRTGTSFTMRDLLECQKSMLEYHSSPKPTHPFESSWYSWPFDWRPIWYYQGAGLREGKYASIASFGNPLLWWGGLACIANIAVRAVRGREKADGAFVLISYAAQFAPWLLVTRSAFIYHYFACVPFLTLALTLALQNFEERIHRDLKYARISLAAAAIALFALFYPALSGLPVSEAYARVLEWLPSWGFY